MRATCVRLTGLSGCACIKIRVGLNGCHASGAHMSGVWVIIGARFNLCGLINSEKETKMKLKWNGNRVRKFTRALWCHSQLCFTTWPERAAINIYEDDDDFLIAVMDVGYSRASSVFPKIYGRGFLVKWMHPLKDSSSRTATHTLLRLKLCWRFYLAEIVLNVKKILE